MDARTLYEAQKAFFDAGHTLPGAFRRAQLVALQAELERREDDIAGALHADLHKAPFEAWATETGIVAAEVRYALDHLEAWMRPVRKLASLPALPGRMVLHAQPLGPSLILGPWNYPLQLCLAPLVGALAAGCPAVVKPSELAPATSALLAELLGRLYPPEQVAVVEGGADVAAALLEPPWAHLFFTGGTRVGRIVARAGAEHLSRVTLELGGKSPAIVLSSAQVRVAARRIAWAKLINAGQTCVAPDHAIVHTDVHDAFVTELQRAVRDMLGDDPQRSPDFGRIIDDRHLSRLLSLIDRDRVAFGGQHDAAERYLAPTVLTGVTPDDPVMKEEIFGPILPVLRVGGLDEALAIVRRNPDPLALYLFTEDAAERDRVIGTVSFGGGCVNTAVLHMAAPDAPFGGIRTSGIGAYHGKASFDAFTHVKAVLEAPSSPWLDVPLKYPPHDARKLALARWLLV